MIEDTLVSIIWNTLVSAFKYLKHSTCHSLGMNSELFSIIEINLINAMTETWSAGNCKTRVTSLVKNPVIALNNLSLIEGTVSMVKYLWPWTKMSL